MTKITKKSTSKAPPNRNEMQGFIRNYLYAFANGKLSDLRAMIYDKAKMNIAGVSEKFITNREELLKNRADHHAVARLEPEAEIKYLRLTKCDFDKERNEMLVVADANYPMETLVKGNDLAAHAIVATIDLNLHDMTILDLSHNVDFRRHETSKNAVPKV